MAAFIQAAVSWITSPGGYHNFSIGVAAVVKDLTSGIDYSVTWLICEKSATDRSTPYIRLWRRIIPGGSESIFQEFALAGWASTLTIAQSAGNVTFSDSSGVRYTWTNATLTVNLTGFGLLGAYGVVAMDEGSWDDFSIEAITGETASDNFGDASIDDHWWCQPSKAWFEETGGKLLINPLGAGSAMYAQWWLTPFTDPYIDSLYCDSSDASAGQTQPQNVDLNPHFSFVYHNDYGRDGADYELAVFTDISDPAGSLEQLKSGSFATPVVDGNRSEDLELNSDLLLTRQLYYWAARVYDGVDWTDWHYDYFSTGGHTSLQHRHLPHGVMLGRGTDAQLQIDRKLNYTDLAANTEEVKVHDAAFPGHPNVFSLGSTLGYAYIVGQAVYLRLSTDDGKIWGDPVSLISGYDIVEAEALPHLGIVLLLIYAASSKRWYSVTAQYSGGAWSVSTPAVEVADVDFADSRGSLRMLPDWSALFFCVDDTQGVRCYRCAQVLVDGSGTWAEVT